MIVFVYNVAKPRLAEVHVIAYGKPSIYKLTISFN